MKKYKIRFEPSGCTGNFPGSATILACARALQINLVSVCGGNGACGKCLVRLLDGSITPVSDAERAHIGEEDLALGYRLACQVKPLGDCRVYIPPTSLSNLQRAQVEGVENHVEPEPVVRTCKVALSPPSLTDLLPDMERLAGALVEQCRNGPVRADIGVLRELSPLMRQGEWVLKAVLRDDEIIGLLPEAASPLGLAVDLGTSNIASYLVDLSNGRTLCARGIANPQAALGADIITRMAAAVRSPEDARELRDTVVDAVNKVADEMCREVGAGAGSLADFVLAGNTAMHHLFLGLPVEQLCKAPYVPVIKSSLDIKSREAGLKGAPGAWVHLLPNVAGYIGADHVAMLLAAGLHTKSGNVLAIDIGTNTEICLAKNNELTSVSCASGPAFEGAHISNGMRAADGAIEHFRLSGDRVDYQVIGGGRPRGICGSGIIDIMAQLLVNGIIDGSGRLRAHSKVKEKDGTPGFVISSGNGKHADIVFTQKDIRELQLAKGAIRTGIRVLLETGGLKEADIGEVIIAGAFGAYIDIGSAITIGMLPDIPQERFQQVGNAAGMGAKMALISASKRREAGDIARRVKYIELASYPGFNKIFAAALSLGRTG